MSDVDVATHGFQLAFAQQARVQGLVGDRCRELAVRDQIGVAPDGRREVRVDGRGEAVVPEVGRGLRAGGEVFCGHHAARGEDADEGVEEGLLGVGASVEGVSEGFARVGLELQPALDFELGA